MRKKCGQANPHCLFQQNESRHAHDFCFLLGGTSFLKSTGYGPKKLPENHESHLALNRQCRHNLNFPKAKTNAFVHVLLVVFERVAFKDG